MKDTIKNNNNNGSSSNECSSVCSAQDNLLTTPKSSCKQHNEISSVAQVNFPVGDIRKNNKIHFIPSYNNKSENIENISTTEHTERQQLSSTSPTQSRHKKQHNKMYRK